MIGEGETKPEIAANETQRERLNTIATTMRQNEVKDCRLNRLPETHVGEILDYLSLKERRRLLGSCTALWSLRVDLEGRVQTLQAGGENSAALVPRRRGRASGSAGGQYSGLFLRRSGDDDETSTSALFAKAQDLGRREYLGRLRNLRVLDLRGAATDELFELICGEEGEVLLSSLDSISMVASDAVTDRGLERLSRGEARASNLRSVDITFCRKTSYAGTFPLRDRLKNLRLIRRQPEWLDGSYVTPFGGAGPDKDEVHIYWPDGSFSFGRNEQSSGFVCDLFEWRAVQSVLDGEGGGQNGMVEDRHLGDKLQYVDFDPPLGWPEWSRYAYRPGVSLLRLPDEKVNEQNVRSVLVAQRLAGLKPPHDFPSADHANQVPLGETRYFDERGQFLPVEGGGTDEEIEQRRRLRHTMVSRMRVEPLPQGGRLLPPDSLVDRNRDFCGRMQAAVDMGPMGPAGVSMEDVLHLALLPH